VGAVVWHTKLDFTSQSAPISKHYKLLQQTKFCYESIATDSPGASMPFTRKIVSNILHTLTNLPYCHQICQSSQVLPSKNDNSPNLPPNVVASIQYGFVAEIDKITYNHTHGSVQLRGSHTHWLYKVMLYYYSTITQRGNKQ